MLTFSLNRLIIFFLSFLLITGLKQVSEAKESLYIKKEVTTSPGKFIPIYEINFSNDPRTDIFNNLWKDSYSKYISLWIKALSNKSRFKTSEQLKEKILLSSFKGLKIDNKDKSDLFQTKLKILTGINNMSAINTIIDKAPKNLITEEMNKIYMAGLINNKQHRKTCNSLITELNEEYDNLFWHKFLITCYAFINKQASAKLSLAALEEDSISAKAITNEERSIIDGLISRSPIIRLNTEKRWLSLLKSKYLTIEIPEISLPAVSNTDRYESQNDFLSAEEKELNDRLKDIINLSSSSRGDQEPETERYLQLFNYAITKNIAVPEYLIKILLKDATENFSTGEILLIAVHITDSYNDSKNHPDFSEIIKLLSDLQLYRESETLKQEILNSENNG